MATVAPVVAPPTDATSDITRFKQQLTFAIVLLSIFGSHKILFETAFAVLRLLMVLSCVQILFTLVGMPDFLEQTLTVQAFINSANGVIGVMIFFMTAPANLLLALGRRFKLITQ